MRFSKHTINFYYYPYFYKRVDIMPKQNNIIAVVQKTIKSSNAVARAKKRKNKSKSKNIMKKKGGKRIMDTTIKRILTMQNKLHVNGVPKYLQKSAKKKCKKNETSKIQSKHDFNVVYILRSDAENYRKGTVYIGMTSGSTSQKGIEDDLDVVLRRMNQHNYDDKKGANETSKARPWIVMGYVTGFKSRNNANSFEWVLQHPTCGIITANGWAEITRDDKVPFSQTIRQAFFMISYGHLNKDNKWWDIDLQFVPVHQDAKDLLKHLQTTNKKY